MAIHMNMHWKKVRETPTEEFVILVIPEISYVHPSQNVIGHKFSGHEQLFSNLVLVDVYVSAHSTHACSFMKFKAMPTILRECTVHRLKCK